MVGGVGQKAMDLLFENIFTNVGTRKISRN